jgi:hypothetical protein
MDSPLYIRGELEQAAEIVPRGLVHLAGEKRAAPITRGSGRLELAQWLASRQNPLTARVMVNRVWLHLFGRGLVATPDNFGASGQPPSHPELLDALAVTFMDNGWSLKQLIRQIVSSRAYQLASSHDSSNFEADPDNILVWRMGKKRLEAEAIRDAVLFASGRLIVEPPVGSAAALAGEGRAGPNRRFNQDAQDMHRAVYLPVVRDQVADSLALCGPGARLPGAIPRAQGGRQSRARRLDGVLPGPVCDRRVPLPRLDRKQPAPEFNPMRMVSHVSTSFDHVAQDGLEDSLFRVRVCRLRGALIIRLGR